MGEGGEWSGGLLLIDKKAEPVGSDEPRQNNTRLSAAHRGQAAGRLPRVRFATLATVGSIKSINSGSSRRRRRYGSSCGITGRAQ